MMEPDIWYLHQVIHRSMDQEQQEICLLYTSSDLEIEQATIEDVMLYCVRGEKVA